MTFTLICKQLQPICYCIATAAVNTQALITLKVIKQQAFKPYCKDDICCTFNRAEDSSICTTIISLTLIIALYAISEQAYYDVPKAIEGLGSDALYTRDYLGELLQGLFQSAAGVWLVYL